MSRTEGVTLPRLPTSHVRVTSPTSVQPQSVKQETKHHRRTFSEPSYTAYVGTPRQDVPPQVYCDAAMFDDVFDKKGKLLASRNTPKISSPLHTLQYNSLHDPHCRKLFLNNKKLRTHLIHLGLITNDLRVVANTLEQRQKIRSHELLERREQLMQSVEDRERQRLERLHRQASVPKEYWESLVKEEERSARAQAVRKLKVDKLLQAERKQQLAVERQREHNRQRLQQAMEEARLMEQARRNTARARQEMAERVTYERQYGKHLANWHRDSDRIHNRMIIMEHKHWSKKRKQAWLSESYPLQSPHSTESSVVAVERVPRLPPISVPWPGSDATQREAADTTQAETKHQPTSTEGDTAAPLHPPPVPQSDTEQQEREPVKQTVAEPKDVLVMDRETGPVAEPQEPDVTPHAKAGTEKTQDEGKGVLEEGEDVRDEGLAAPPPQLEVVVLNPEQSTQELTHILVDALQRLDYRRTGFIHSDDFTQLLNSRDLGLQLNEDELLYVASQVDVYGNGWVPFIQVAPFLPNLLLTIYRQRAEEAIQQYGEYSEEQWCQLYPHSGSTCYFNKLTGVLQYGRPDDFRPFLKEEVFEDSIVDFFEIADANKDGVLEYDELYVLLVSPMVSTRIYSNQMEQLLQLYQAYAVGGRMRLEEFVPVARTLLLMIYQNAYPDVEEWIELDSRKYGAFWFNKVSGETIIPSESYAAEAEANLQPVAKQPAPETGQDGVKLVKEMEDGTPPPKARKKKKHSKAKRSTPEEGTERPPSQGPPPLRRRSSKSRESTSEEVHVQEESKEEPLQTTEKNDEVDTEMITSTTEPVTAVPNSEVDSEVQIPVPGKQRLESILEEDEEDVSEESQRNENAETRAAKDGCGGSQDGPTVNQLSEAKGPTDGEQHKQDHAADEQQSRTDCQDHPRQYSDDNSTNHETKSSPETVNIGQEQENPRDDAGGSKAGQKVLVETEGYSSHSSHEHTHQLQDDSEQLVNTHQS